MFKDPIPDFIKDIHKERKMPPSVQDVIDVLDEISDFAKCYKYITESQLHYLNTFIKRMN